jgi:hypothetical protein
MGRSHGSGHRHNRSPIPLDLQVDVALTFELCPECLAKYRALRYEPACDYTLNVMPFCSLQWADEHPENASRDIFLDDRHKQCAACIIRLVGARTRLWRTDAVPEDRRELWDEARRAIPDWPGFRRLSLDESQLRSLDGCAEELNDLIGAMTRDFPHVTLTDKGGGLTEFSARRAPPQPPMRAMEFTKGLAHALALEFYPADATAFARELPAAREELSAWRASHGDRCEMVLFTVVAAPEHHAAIESTLAQASRDEANLAPVLRSVEVRVALHVKAEEDPVKQYALAASTTNKPARSWWRFW